MVVHPGVPAGSINELLALARARPGQMTYGSGGIGTASHLATELLELMTQTDMIHVPYKGLGPALTDLMGGRVQVIISTLASALPQLKAGKLKPLAVTTAGRSAFLPELPTLSEAGVKGYEFSTWYGLLVPGATPNVVVERLNAAAVRALQSPSVKEQFAAQGLEATPSTPAEFGAYFRAEVAKWGEVILSHGHRDHAGALKFLPDVGNPPLHATAAVLARLGCAGEGRALPLKGETRVCGVRVRTGRNGHAPGGIWLHFDIEGGLLYTGDYGMESPVFERSSALLPVPPDGRGPEIAYHLANVHGSLPCLGSDLRASVERMARDERESLRPGVADALARIARDAPPIAGPQGILLAGRADGSDGETAGLVARWEAEVAPEIVFTGYFPPGSPAQRLVDSKRASYVRWNAHPRLADNAALARAVGARAVMPAFGDAARHLEAWRKALAPARVVIERELVL